ncbi:MAG: WD40 repeat domain-containing protein [Leptolyngbyaceae cyanobacterium SL_5_9]|nr:WD40 repeat domain-containing protein [Leptolyngbyaceae cyanobacterium SL_5_9]
MDNQSLMNWLASAPRWEQEQFLYDLPRQLANGQRKQELEEYLYDFEFLEAKLFFTSFKDLSDDYELVKNLECSSGLELIQKSLQMSASVLQNDWTQLASQLIGRLSSVNDNIIQQQFIPNINPSTNFWLRPLIVNLTPPQDFLIRTLRTNSETGIEHILITSDSSRAVSASHFNAIEVWDLNTDSAPDVLVDKEYQALTGYERSHSHSIAGLSITSDSAEIVSVFTDGALKIWNLESKQKVQSYIPCLPLPTADWNFNLVRSIASTADGNHLFTGHQDGSLRMINLKNGAVIFEAKPQQSTIYSIVYIPSHKAIAIGAKQEAIKIWHLNDARVQMINVQTSSFPYLAVTTDGKKLVIGATGQSSQDIDVFNLETGSQLFSLKGHNMLITAIAVTPDDKRLISGDDTGHIRIWDLASGALILAYRAHSTRITAIGSTQDCRRILTGSEDNTLKIWNLEAPPPKNFTESKSNRVERIIISPDNNNAVIVYSNRISVWNISDKEELFSNESLVFPRTRDSDFILIDNKHALSLTASTDFSICFHIWDVKTGKTLYILRTGLISSYDIPVSFSFCSNRNQVILLTWNIMSENTSFIHVLDIPFIDLSNLSSEETYECSLAYTLNFTKRLLKVDVVPGTEKVVITTKDNCFTTLFLSTRKLIETIHFNSDPLINTEFIITRNGKHLLIEIDQIIEIWSLELGQKVGELREDSGRASHTSVVCGFGIIGNDRSLVSVSRDQTIKVWNLSNYKLEATFTGENIFSCCAATSNGIVIAGDQIGNLYFLQKTQSGASHFCKNTRSPSG